MPRRMRAFRTPKQAPTDRRTRVSPTRVLQGYNFFHHIGMDRNMRDTLRDHPCYDRTARFVERYDNPAFDGTRACLPLETFVPVERVFAAQKKSMYAVRP
jgi:hypothetical protein